MLPVLVGFVVPSLVLGVRVFRSAFPPPSAYRNEPWVPPAQIVRAGSSPLRPRRTELRHPIDSALRAFGGALLVTAGLGVAANCFWWY
jgi:hypothetical protein